ncbi:MAG: hypothetical protein CVU18_21425 [Betaproteobacteria bacterium HGW-Betaproteobacteria-12]|nr:MAG: hypothetical protein CVU18_21425 [Betaproteobacteria bacterium HGW-Betaproteobacteria-12]
MGRPLPIKNHHEAMQHRISIQGLLGRLSRDSFQKFWNDILNQRRGKSACHCFGDHEKWTPQRVVHPIIRGSTETQTFTRDKTARKGGYISMIDANMAVNIQISSFFRLVFHPELGQCHNPRAWISLSSHRGDFLSKGANFRNAVKTDHFA